MNDRKKKYIRALSSSGDFYSGTAELWKQYWYYVESGDWDSVEKLEKRKISSTILNKYVYRRFMFVYIILIKKESNDETETETTSERT